MPPPSVFVWHVSLLAQPLRLIELEQLLSPDERARMSRYCFEHTRRAFAVSRASLRMILAGYCDAAATTLPLQYNAFGKPVLGAPFDHVQFNLSHSGEVAIVAVSEDGAVGVDIERMRPVPDALDMARRFFSRGEFDLLQRAPDHDRERSFFMLWTRKEACLKMLGHGLSLDSTLFDVSAPEKVALAKELENALGERLSPMWVQDVRVPTGYIAAVAAEGAARTIEVRTLGEQAVSS